MNLTNHYATVDDVVRATGRTYAAASRWMTKGGWFYKGGALSIPAGRLANEVKAIGRLRAHGKAASMRPPTKSEKIAAVRERTTPRGRRALTVNKKQVQNVNSSWYEHRIPQSVIETWEENLNE